MRLVSDYVRIEGPGYVAHAHRVCADWVREVLPSETLYSWAARQPGKTVHQGRLPAYQVSVAGLAKDVVVRHSHHGGLLGGLRGDLFLPPTRAHLELARSYMLVRDGVRTPLVLATAVYKATWILRRSDVVTVAVDGSTLGALLRQGAPLSRWVGPVAELLEQLGQRGLWHPDLNVNNILLGSEPEGTPVAYVLDIDRLQHALVDPRSVNAANLGRLERSIRKWSARHGIHSGGEGIAALRLELQQRFGWR